jgi:hypothetical protein
MNPPENSVAFGAPGIEPRWTSSAKHGLGTAYHASCRFWFALSHSVLLMHTKVEVLDESLRGKLRLHTLLAPHITRHGAGNSGWCSEVGGNKLLHAERKDVHLVLKEKECQGPNPRRSY